MAAIVQRMVSTFAPVGLAGLALLVGVIWFLGTPGPVYACKCAQPGTPSEELEKFSAVFAGRVRLRQELCKRDQAAILSTGASMATPSLYLTPR